MGSGLSLAMAGGGTGGHVVPGLHLLSHFLAGPLALEDCLWFLSGRAVEEEALAGLEAVERRVARRIERVVLDLEPPGGGAPSKARLLARIGPATAAARRALKRHGSQVCLGLGGYTSVPACLAARTLGIPVAVYEINTVPGLATRWLTPLAARVFHAWPDSVPERGGKHVLTGPPLGPGFFDRTGPEEARAALGFERDRPLLLVLGGSQGAGALNRFVSAFAGRIIDAGGQILHQVGPGRLDEGLADQPAYRREEYLRPMQQALAAATCVLARGGASTVAEVGAMRRPAVIVPYPHFPDRHQEQNARRLGAGALVVPEEELGESTCDELIALLGDAERRERMAEALAGAVPADAGERMRDELIALV